MRRVRARLVSKVQAEVPLGCIVATAIICAVYSLAGAPGDGVGRCCRRPAGINLSERGTAA